MEELWTKQEIIYKNKAYFMNTIISLNFKGL